MVPTPQAPGLTLCDRVIIEQGTKNPTLVSIFLARTVDRFPSEPVAFSAFASLTGGSGAGTIELAAVRLETNDLIYSQRGDVAFPHPTTTVNAEFRVRKLRFPASGLYAFLLLIDGQLIAQRVVDVSQREGPP